MITRIKSLVSDQSASISEEGMIGKMMEAAEYGELIYKFQNIIE